MKRLIFLIVLFLSPSAHAIDSGTAKLVSHLLIGDHKANQLRSISFAKRDMYLFEFSRTLSEQANVEAGFFYLAVISNRIYDFIYQRRCMRNQKLLFTSTEH